MERLTEHGRTYTFPKIDPCENKYIEQVQMRLAAYEDTGLEPAEINVVAGLASENCYKAADAVDKLLSDDAELDTYRALGTVEELAANMEMFAAYRHVCGGLPPERVAALVKAQEEGRVVALPCKVERVKEAVEGVHGSFGCFFDAIGLSNDYGDCRKGCFRCVMDGLRNETEAALRTMI